MRFQSVSIIMDYFTQIMNMQPKSHSDDIIPFVVTDFSVGDSTTISETELTGNRNLEVGIVNKEE
jgi:hypothetical protein